MKLEKIQRRIDEITEELSELGPLHPGSISEQYNVCGTPGCRCKDPKNPQKHGPYYQLSYTWRGKSSSLFVRKEQLQMMREQVANYKRFRDLTNEWVDLSLELAQQKRQRKKRP